MVVTYSGGYAIATYSCLALAEPVEGVEVSDKPCIKSCAEMHHAD